jgi:uroporphyrinogen-III synthase
MALNLRFEMRTSEELAEKIDAWRTQQRPVLTRGEAARQLIEKGLEARQAEEQTEDGAQA